MENELSGLPRGRVLWLLFFNFFKIALFVVGGGYAIILAAEDIFIRKLHGCNDQERGHRNTDQGDQSAERA